MKKGIRLHFLIGVILVLASLIITFSACAIPTASEDNGDSTLRKGASYKPNANPVMNSEIASNSASTITMPPVFDDEMVFQRDKDINVFGYCDNEGATVEVTLDGITKTATVSDGKWLVTFDPLPAKKGLTLTVTEATSTAPTTLTFENVDIGEVWLMGGQSNAQYEAYKIEDIDEYILNADNYDNIRFYSAPMKTTPVEMPLGTGGGWHQVTSELLLNDKNTKDYDISAIAYVMATRLAAELDGNVTVAVLDVNYSGSKIVTWLDEEIYKEHFPNNSDITVYEQYKEFYLANGKLPASTDELASYKAKPYGWLPSGNYNAMMSCLSGFNIKGALWMQGESDISLANYDEYYELLLKTFRTTFNDDKLPCFVIQIHPYGNGVNTELRSQQYSMVANDPYSYLLTAATEGTVMSNSDFTNNSGDSSFAHESRKSPIAQRLADSVLYYSYGFEEYKNSTTPLVKKVEASGNKLIITFNQEVKTELGASLVEGFEIAGSDGKFVSATGTISGNKITLVAEGVTAPQSVRYGYGVFVFELQDGTIIPYDKKTHTVTYTTQSLTITCPDGTTYVFERDTDLIIRTKLQGNVTNLCGQMLPIFNLEVGYTAD